MRLLPVFQWLTNDIRYLREEHVVGRWTSFAPADCSTAANRFLSLARASSTLASVVAEKRCHVNDQCLKYIGLFTFKKCYIRNVLVRGAKGKMTGSMLFSRFAGVGRKKSTRKHCFSSQRNVQILQTWDGERRTQERQRHKRKNTTNEKRSWHDAAAEFKLKSTRIMVASKNSSTEFVISSNMQRQVLLKRKLLMQLENVPSCQFSATCPLCGWKLRSKSQILSKFEICFEILKNFDEFSRRLSFEIRKQRWHS